MRLLSIEGSREWMVRGSANDRPISYEYLLGGPEPINREIIDRLNIWKRSEAANLVFQLIFVLNWEKHSFSQSLLKLQTSHRRVTGEYRRVTDDYRWVTDELQTTTYESQTTTDESQKTTDESQTSHRRVTDESQTTKDEPETNAVEPQTITGNRNYKVYFQPLT